MPSAGQPSAHHELVLGVQERVRPGVHGDALGDQRPQVLLRHLLVVEGHGRAAARERPQRRAGPSPRPARTSGATSAAGSSGPAASTRSDCPSAIAAWWVMRASWPAPIMPTTGSVHGVREPTGVIHARPRSGTIDGVTVVESVLGAIPQPYRGVAIRHRELVKFAIVGGTTWVIDTAVFLTLKSHRAGARSRSPRRSSPCSWRRSSPTSSTASGPSAPAAAASATTRPLLFFLISGIGVAVYSAPLAVSRYVLDLKVPGVSLLTQEIADFVSGQIVGMLVGMAFRWWAFRRFVFPHKDVRRQVPSA